MAEAPSPLNANYYANLAALEFAKAQTLGADNAGRQQAETTYNYNRGQLQRAEPLKLTANRNNANAGGIAESGILAQRQGQTQTDFATKGNQVSEQRRAAIEKYNQGDKAAEDAFRVGQNKALAESTEQAKKELLENPPQAQVSYPTLPAQAASTVPAQAGGVVPYTSNQPGAGFVKVGQPLKALRNAAAKKAVG
jgi:hypothetical protein